MWKKYFVLAITTLAFIFAAGFCLNTASLQTNWAGIAAIGFLVLMWLYTKVWKWVFKGFNTWLEQVAEDKRQALKSSRIELKKTSMPPPAPKPTHITQAMVNEKLSSMSANTPNFHEPEGEE